MQRSVALLQKNIGDNNMQRYPQQKLYLEGVEGADRREGEGEGFEVGIEVGVDPNSASGTRGGADFYVRIKGKRLHNQHKT